MKGIHVERSGIITVVGLVVIIGLVFLVTILIKQNHYHKEIGAAASEVLHESTETPYTDVNGNPFSFDTYRNKIRIAYIWASWSPSTANEFLVLQDIGTAYKDKNVVVLAVNRKEPKERAQAYLNTLTQDVSNIVFTIDETDAFYRLVEGFAMPETVIFNERGDIVWHYRGILTKDVLTEQLGPLTQ